VGDEGAQAIGTNLKQLTSLDLGGNQVRDEGRRRSDEPEATDLAQPLAQPGGRREGKAIGRT